MFRAALAQEYQEHRRSSLAALDSLEAQRSSQQVPFAPTFSQRMDALERDLPEVLRSLRQASPSASPQPGGSTDLGQPERRLLNLRGEAEQARPVNLRGELRASFQAQDEVFVSAQVARMRMRDLLSEARTEQVRAESPSAFSFRRSPSLLSFQPADPEPVSRQASKASAAQQSFKASTRQASKESVARSLVALSRRAEEEEEEEEKDLQDLEDARSIGSRRTWDARSVASRHTWKPSAIQAARMNIDAFVALHDSEQEAALEAVQELKNQLLEQHSELMEQQNELFDREEQLLEKEEQLQYQKVETEVVEYNLKKERDLNERLALSNQTLVAKNGTLEAETKSAARDLKTASAMLGISRNAFRAKVCGGGSPRRRGRRPFDPPGAPYPGSDEEEAPNRRGPPTYAGRLEHPRANPDIVSLGSAPGERNIFRRGTANLWRREESLLARDPDIAALLGEYPTKTRWAA